MLRDNGLMDKYPEVIAAMGDVVIRGGYGTSVTPVSQFYFQQAFNNVMFGPWKKIAEGYGKMVLGYFGKTPSQPDPEIVKIASEQLKLQPTSANPMDLNDANPAKGRAAAVAMLEANKLPTTDENIFIAASCLEKGIAFLKGEGKIGVRKNVRKEQKAEKPAARAKQLLVTINGNEYNVKLDKGTAVINGQNYAYDVKAADGNGVSALENAATGSSVEKFKEVHATLPGTVIRILVKPGEHVKAEQPIMILEAMKMETQVSSPIDGIVAKFQVNAQDQVQTGSLLALIKYE